ncbi:dTDP-4-dehydrorhamnose 3,5-epimerase family protein [Micromonospora chersina]|uniref:dTDP-4-dehydrorhamnose 3,5-epimerase family protein n=1 Tax=Micromonospora chersina TaxID=47854 RepID=UPI0033DC70E9
MNAQPRLVVDRRRLRPPEATASAGPQEVHQTAIAGLVALRVRQTADARGTVREFFRASTLAGAGLATGPWKQVNVTSSNRGVIRGLHSEPVTKLAAVLAGKVMGAYVDIRPTSPTRGAVVTLTLGVDDQVLIPPGVCQGFQAISQEPAQYMYLMDEEWRPGLPGVGIHPLDPALAIRWPLPVTPGDTSLLSAKDASQAPLADSYP